MAHRAYQGDEWGDSRRLRDARGYPKPSDDIMLNSQTELVSDGLRYSPNNYEIDNFHASPPPAYGELHRVPVPLQVPPPAQYPAQSPAPAQDMSHNYQPSRPSPWYRKKAVWAAVALVIIIVIVVPVAVVVSRNKKNNSYPNYSKLNYTLLETYSGETFFDNFDYYTGYDPAHGLVHYVPKEEAAQLNLTYAGSSTAVLRVDTTVGPSSVPDASTGRFSVRLESKTQYPVGTLFLFDVRHTPYGCGTWPALWLSDPNPAVWPANGEIDVLEATNLGDAGNTASLHTTKGCTMRGVRRDMSGLAGQADCYNGTNSNTGCGVTATGSGNASAAHTFGSGFNGAGGGVVAVELREAGIRIWSFLRDQIPSDVEEASAPDPSAWGTAFADFPSTDCDISGHFRNQSIIANIDLCGDLVEAKWNSSGCANTCSDWVANYPASFSNAYWEFGSFKVYKSS